MRQTDLATACDQLASLLSSGLPLSVSLRELAGTSPARSRRALTRLAAETNSGQSLADAMANDDAFEPSAVALIRAGEASDSLPEMLSELASVSWQRQRTVEQLRQIIAYPMIVCYLALVLYCVLQVFVTPTLQTAFAEIDGAALHGLTTFTFAVSECLVAHFQLTAIALALVGACGVWLLIGEGVAVTVLATVVTWLPGGASLLRTLDLGRACRYLASLLARRTAMHDAMSSAAAIVFDQQWRDRLNRWAQRHQAGSSLAELVAEDKLRDQLLVVAFTDDLEKSRGTRNMVMLAKKAGIPVRIVSSERKALCSGLFFSEPIASPMEQIAYMKELEEYMGEEEG